MDKQIISTKEARKLLGKDSKKLNDKEVIKLIDDLSFIAHEAIKSFEESKQNSQS